MKATRFFSVAFDIRHHPKIEILRMSCGGIAALGRWVALLGILYDSDGVFDLTKSGRTEYLAHELELTTDELDAFLISAAECELIDANLLQVGHVVSHGVCEQLEYQRQKSEAGKMGGRPKKQTEKHPKKHPEKHVL